ncbi:MAG: IS1634 family transposase [Nitrospira sp.]
MDTELSVTQERLDDVPLIFAMARQLGLPEIIDKHLGRHGNHQGLGYGWLAATWIAYILSEGDHRKSAVEDWASRRQMLLGDLTGETVREAEFNDDRLGRLLEQLGDPEIWRAIEQDLWRQTVIAYELDLERVRLDSTASFGYHETTEGGLMQFGHSKDHRPDKPQLKLMAAVAEPSAQMIASEVHPGHRADDGLYLPLIERVRQVTGRSGLLYIGDAKMAARETCGAIVAAGDHYLTRLPRSACANEIDAWITAALTKPDLLTPIQMEAEDGTTGIFGHGYEFERQVERQGRSFTERVVVYRSDAMASREIAQFDTRIQAATDAYLALNPPVGRGRRQLTSDKAFTESLHRVNTQHRLAGLLWVKWRKEACPSRDDPDRQRWIVSEVVPRADLIDNHRQRLGWQVLITSLPADSLSTPEVVRTYNAGWLIENQFRDIKNRPLGIRPLFVSNDTQIAGLTHLILIALRLMTLITSRVRTALAKTGQTLVGLYEGQKSRATDRPTARRLLRAFYREEVALTRIRSPGLNICHVSPLSPLLTAILGHLGLSATVYTNLARTSAK